MAAIYRQSPLHVIGITPVTHIKQDIDLGLQRALVDRFALEGLSRLIEGPIESWATLKSAELAARAFVFHDAVHFMVPRAVRRLVETPHGKITEILSIWSPATEADPEGGAAPPDRLDFPNLSQLILAATPLALQIEADNRLYEFQDEKAAVQFVERFNQQVIEKRNANAQHNAQLPLGSTDIRVDFFSEPLTFIANDWDTYYEETFYKDDELGSGPIKLVAGLMVD